MTDDELYREAYNAHETAEAAAFAALRASLEAASTSALACLCDPRWRWDTRSWISLAIIDQADDVLTDRLNAAVAL